MEPEGFLRGADKDICPGSVAHGKIVPVRFTDNALGNVYFFRHQTVKIVVKIGVEVVIAVHEADEASFRFVQGGVPGGAGTGVDLVNDPDAAVLPCPPVADFTAVVRRAVVHQEDF